MELLEKSIVIAHASHARQLDKQGKPYILHPLAVLVNVIRHERYTRLDRDDRTMACCVAMLHDLVEDTETGLEDIYARRTSHGRSWHGLRNGLATMNGSPGEMRRQSMALRKV